MSAERLWPASVPVAEHLRRVRAWGGTQEWLDALDRAEQILAPKWEGKVARWDIQDGAPGIALMVYLIVRGNPSCRASDVTEKGIVEAFPTVALEAWSGIHLEELFAEALRYWGHDIDVSFSADPIVRVWHDILLRVDRPSSVGDTEAGDVRVGTVLDTGVRAIVCELSRPGSWLVACCAKG
ncbi:hypothetical protein [Saccharopolyspora endophytica]|uniref:Uncharacterized protein n=1 Tax=Saccharopolyspora endophytica TaxID=543886 RepID=A0ABS5DRE4_9PSEU|nr:hypothetical protein [Saccharopolyspora endophytica]MBQ0928612.1 hypothetical protein [Saccharopolyspora endophytica]